MHFDFLLINILKSHLRNHYKKKELQFIRNKTYTKKHYLIKKLSNQKRFILKFDFCLVLIF